LDNVLIGLLGLSGVILVGGVALWATVAKEGRDVPAWIPWLTLIGGLGVLLSASSVLFNLQPPGFVNSALPTAPRVNGALVPPGSPIVLYQDDFTTDLGQWQIGSRAINGGYLTSTVVGGALVIDVSSSDRPLFEKLNPNTTSVTNVDLSVTSERLDGPADAAYGLFIRDDGRTSEIFYLINSQRQFSVFARDQRSGVFTALVPWTSHPSIKESGPNRMRIVAVDRQITVFANDTQLTSFAQDILHSGKSGVIIVLYSPNQTARFVVDDFRLVRAQ
jgi:hypothetical protein